MLAALQVEQAAEDPVRVLGSLAATVEGAEEEARSRAVALVGVVAEPLVGFSGAAVTPALAMAGDRVAVGPGEDRVVERPVVPRAVTEVAAKEAEARAEAARAEAREEEAREAAREAAARAAVRAVAARAVVREVVVRVVVREGMREGRSQHWQGR